MEQPAILKLVWQNIFGFNEPLLPGKENSPVLLRWLIGRTEEYINITEKWAHCLTLKMNVKEKKPITEFSYRHESMCGTVQITKWPLCYTVLCVVCASNKEAECSLICHCCCASTSATVRLQRFSSNSAAGLRRTEVHWHCVHVGIVLSEEAGLFPLHYSAWHRVATYMLHF